MGRAGSVLRREPPAEGARRLRLVAAGSGAPGLIVGGVVFAVVVLAMVAITRSLRRRGYSGVGGRAVVRCEEGHRFATTWVPGASMHAVRLGATRRYQRCPVGSHWSVVHLVPDAELTDAERLDASAIRSGRRRGDTPSGSAQ